MAYATQSDLIERFGTDEITQISDESGTGTLDAGRVTQALTDAGAKIDSFLIARYTLPLSTVPDALNLLACDIARYLLARLPTDEMRKRYEDALRFLRSVATGEFGLGVDNAGGAPTEIGGTQISADRRVFTRQSLEDFIHPQLHRPGWP